MSHEGWLESSSYWVKAVALSDDRKVDALRLDGAGSALRELRIRRGLTLQQLATRMGCTRGSISKYENDRLAISLSVLEQIATALGVRPEVILLAYLRHRYPALAKSKSKVGRLLDEVVHELHSEFGEQNKTGPVAPHRL
jgi:transcriptional regulator with XRE-family HTH domain